MNIPMTLKKTLFVLIAALLCEATAFAAGQKEVNPPAEPEPRSKFAIVGGRLIDGNGGKPIEDCVIIVEGNHITQVGVREDIEIPKSVKTIDASGKSVLPGLIDSHFHSRNTTKTPIEYELNHGITSFRDPGHPFKYYETVMAADVTLPRVFLCGGHLDAAPAVWPDQAKVVANAQQAKQTVFDHVDNGASAIKVYFRLPLEHIKAVCEAAKKRGVVVTAHLELVDADDAIRAGVRGIEHISSFGTALAAESQSERFKAAVFADSNARRELRHRLWAGIDLISSTKAQTMIETIVDHGVFVSPTLAIFEARQGERNATPDEVEGFANMLEFLSKCHQAGARIVVGSHTSAPFAERGMAYFREMELLVECGMTPLEVITAGTRNNAQFFGIDDRLGTIEVGKLADLIIVDGDPAKDISAMRKVEDVMLNGRWVVKAE